MKDALSRPPQDMAPLVSPCECHGGLQHGCDPRKDQSGTSAGLLSPDFFLVSFQKKQTFDSRNAFLVSLRTRSMSQTILVPSLWNITGT